MKNIKITSDGDTGKTMVDCWLEFDDFDAAMEVVAKIRAATAAPKHPDTLKMTADEYRAYMKETHGVEMRPRLDMSNHRVLMDWLQKGGEYPFPVANADTVDARDYQRRAHYAQVREMLRGARQETELPDSQ